MEPTTNTLPSPAVDQLAAAFPQYEIEAELGRGGMGAVYRARHRKLGRLVAIKVLLPEHDGPEFAERFEREARALARLDHPNIVGVQDIGEAGGLYYLVMDFVDGADLRQLINAGELTVKDALTWVPQICDALQYAHDQGVVHRDIKPENVLVDQDGDVHIADFGLAKVLSTDRDALSLTRTRQGLGTPHYMAPEQVADAGEVDHRADIYSLGVMLYELLTGKLPIGRFEPPSHRTKAAKALDDVVMKTLESDPSRRIQSAREMKARIEGVPTAAPSPISRYRKQLAESRRSVIDDQKKPLPKLPWFDFVLFSAVVLGLFMPWAAQWVSPGLFRLYDVWDIHMVGAPAWLVAVVALAVVVIRGLRFAGYAVHRKLAIWLLVPAACYCGWLSITALVSGQAQMRAGLGLTVAAIICWLAVEVRFYFESTRPAPPAKRRRRRRSARTGAGGAAAR